MGRLRGSVAWMLNGQANTTHALEALSADLRALQARVDALQRELHSAQQAAGDAISELRQRQLAEFHAVRAAVAEATDDLGIRLAALSARVDGNR